MKICPRHRRELVGKETVYGTRYSCRVGGCTVVSWSGSTSTPADAATRGARINAHARFDDLWQSGLFKRKEAYKKLAEHLGLAVKDTHIGHFDFETCRKVVSFSVVMLSTGYVEP